PKRISRSLDDRSVLVPLVEGLPPRAASASTVLFRYRPAAHGTRRAGGASFGTEYDEVRMTFDGLLTLPSWGYIAAALALTHVTIASVTIFLHRHQAHRALSLHPIASHFFRFWLWLTTGMVTREWVAVHRKHHARCEGDEDPHS